MNPTKAPRPKLRCIPLLRCPYCLITHLQRKGSWFNFSEGCVPCDYRFEREEGYFIGAPWMVNYPVTALLTLIVIILTFSYFPDLDAVLMAAIISISAAIFAVVFYPFARAIWLYSDHWMHPLTEKDSLK